MPRTDLGQKKERKKGKGGGNELTLILAFLWAKKSEEIDVSCRANSFLLLQPWALQERRRRRGNRLGLTLVLATGE